jgi:sulfofructose kinase
MAKTLVAGRATVDLVMKVDQFSQKGEKMPASAAHFVVGGPGANAAIAMARFQAHPVLVTYLGDDMMGQFIYQALVAESVDMSLIHLDAGARSSVSAAFVNKDADRQTVNFKGSGFAALTPDIKLDFVPNSVLTDNRHPELTAWAVAVAARFGVACVVDAEAPFVAGHAIGATHLAFSKQGLDSYAPGLSVDESLRTAQQETGCWVCVTDGENGVWYLAGDDLVNVPAFAVDAVDTVGAGDVWHGIFALGLGEGLNESDAIVLANAAAALKCREFGGITACLDRASCKRLIEETRKCN